MEHEADDATPPGRAGDVRRCLGLLPGPGRADACGVITGEPGIGKTTLVRALADQAIADGTRVGWGVAGEWEGAFPLWPWHEALAQLDPDQQVVLSHVQRTGDAIANVELMRSVALWLGDLAASGPPVLVIIEDLHAAEPTAVDLFAYLSRRPLPERLSVIATARAGRAELDRLTCRRIGLAGLDADAIEAMALAAGHHLDRGDLHALVRRTGGNPLFVQRLLDNGLGHDVGSQPVPTDIAQLIELQLDDAPPPARDILDALSVLGSATFESIERMTDSAEARIWLTRIPASLIRVDGDHVHFRHGMVREILYDRMQADDRFRLHARAADALRFDAGPITVSHHLARAAATHRTLDSAAAASEAARIARDMGALVEAVDHHRLAVSILSDLDAPDALADAAIDLAVSTAEIGRVGDAEQLLGEVIERDAGQPLDRSTRRRVIREYGRLRWREEPNPSTLDPRRLEQVNHRWLGDSDDPRDRAVFHTARVHVGEIRGMSVADLDDGDLAVEAAHDVDEATIVAEAHVARRRASWCTMIASTTVAPRPRPGCDWHARPATASCRLAPDAWRSPTPSPPETVNGR